MTISDYYDDKIVDAERWISELDQSQLQRRTNEELIDGFMAKHGLELFTIDPLRETALRDAAGNGVAVVVPITSSASIERILILDTDTKNMSFSNRRIFYNPNDLTLSATCAMDKGEIQRRRQHLTDQVGRWSNDITAGQTKMRSAIAAALAARREQLNVQEARLDAIAHETGIKLIRKAAIGSVVVVTPKVKPKIAPLLREPTRDQRRVLDEGSLTGILELIDAQARQFERTPTVFQRLAEEDLRDVILSSLNAVFDGQAAGEAFQGLGKTDIRLVIDKGEIFIAECKKWDGPGSLKDATKQLLDQLTWREGYGVVIVFSQNADFTAVRRSIAETIPGLARVNGTLRTFGEHHWGCHFSLPSDSGSVVEVRFLAYNLFTERPSGRSTVSAPPTNGEASSR